MEKQINKIFWKVKDLPGEKWKKIEGFPLYSVSNKGRVRRDKHESFFDRDGSLRFYPEILMKQQKSGGYMLVTLVYYDNRKELRVNRLVAKAFIKNTNPKKDIFVNHKNENKTDNCVENLEWASPKYNSNYGKRNQIIAEKNKCRQFTDEHKKHLSQSMKGNKNRLGKKNSKKQIEATSKAKSKPVVTNSMSFKNIREAANYFNVRYETFARYLSGKRKMPQKYIELGLRYADK